MKYDNQNTILLINDTPDQLNLMKVLLQQAGYGVLTAEDGQAGLEAARRECPDLIISDVTMPRMDGIALCRAIRADEQLRATPVLLVSAMRVDTPSIVEGLQAGADDYLEAPYDPLRLVAKVARLVERSRSEAALRESEARLRRVVNSNMIGIFFADTSGQITDANDAFLSMLRYTREDLSKGTVSWKTITPAEYARLTDKAVEGLKRTGVCPPYEKEYVRKDQSRVPVLVGSALFEGCEDSGVGFALDISESKQAEQERARLFAREQAARRDLEMTLDALRESEAWLKRLVESSLIGIIMVDLRGHITEANDAFLRMVGYTRKEMLGGKMNWLDMTPPEYRALDEKAIEELHASGVCSPFEKEYLRKDASRVPVLLGVSLLEGWADKCVAFVLDITERKRAEAEQAGLQEMIAKSALEWCLTFDAIDFPVLSLNSQGRVSKLNQAAKDFSENSGEEHTGRAVESIGAGQPWQKAAELVRLIQETGSALTSQVLDQATGKTWEIAANLIPAPGVDHERIILIARDVTQHVEMEASLRRNEMMSLMGSLVAGVAHEVRNPLFAISSILDAFEARFGSREEYRRYTSVLREELGRLTELMEELLDYGKPHRQELFCGALDEVIAQAVCASERLAEHSNVRIVNHASKPLPPVTMDRRRLPKVFLNLLKNAIQHSPPGSTVTIEAEEVSDADQIWIDCVVKDSGTGFQPKDLPRIFEPFFTQRRGGTGLGLSIVQRIAEEHNGKITAGNRPEGGAFMSVRFPVAASD